MLDENRVQAEGKTMSELEDKNAAIRKEGEVAH